MSSALAEGKTGAEEDESQKKLFEMPKVELDEANPNVISISFSGQITLDRSQKSDVALYNRLKHGKRVDLSVAGHVKGSKKTHRRDSDDNVDAIVETKSIVIDSIDS